MNRLCGICNKVRRTTNKESPYVCEICLRSEGRRLILMTTLSNKIDWKGLFWLILVLVIGFTIGYFI